MNELSHIVHAIGDMNIIGSADLDANIQTDIEGVDCFGDDAQTIVCEP